MTRPLELVHHARVVSLNAERSAHWRVRHEQTASWRQAFWALAKQSKHPGFTSPVLVTAQPYQARNKLADAASCVGSVKAAVDGLVDAKVLVDDSPEYVAGVMFLAPQRGPDRLVLTIEEVP